MQARLIELHQQRGRLIERIASQRLALVRDVAPLVAPLSLPTRVAGLLRRGQAFVRGHPYLVGTAVAAVVLFKPRFVWRWTQRGVLAWRAWRDLRKLVPGFLWDSLRSVSGTRPPV